VSRSDSRTRNIAKTIVLAEQDKPTRTLLEDILREQGFATLQADDTDRCLFLALQKNIDAFLLDLELPGGDPVQLCAHLRGIDRYKRTPIIFTAASSTSPSLLSAFDAGADDFLDKPINTVVATARLRGHLQRMTYLREMEEVQANLNRYISTRTQQVVKDRAVAGKSLEPEERTVCVLFSDVRGFTTVDKFGGDGIMAIFDARDGVSEACQCALEIMETTRHGRSHDGPPTLPLGIGLNLGSVLIGNIGSEEHLDYSAIGDTVNLAARLCGSARPMSIIVSEAIVAQASADATLNFVDRRSISVRGIQDSVSVCSLERGEGIRPRTAQPAYAAGKFDRRGT
jgi:class 3 adenylate cyclase